MTSIVQGFAPAFAVLQQGEGIGGEARYIASEPDKVLWGRIPHAGDTPIASIDPGQSVLIDTISHEGILEDQGSDPVAYFGRHGVERDHILCDAIEVTTARKRDSLAGPHIVTGPIAVNGARPGDLLAIRIDDLTMRAPYGVVSTRHNRGVLAHKLGFDGDYGQFCSVESRAGQWFGRMPLHPDRPHAAEFPLNPFLGLIGVATDTDARLSSVPPGQHGGNIDIRRLTPGATLFLPVQVSDALFYIGDPHFAQGNGEVALTALEAPLRARLTVDLIPAATVTAGLGRPIGPFAAAHGFVIPTGLDPDLNRALEACVRNTIEMVVALFDADPQQAYLYLSAATDFNISQAVDQVRGVHGEIRVADFAQHATTELARRILERA
ncbi:acetamidase/formamidase family protein [Nocardia sp. NBC_01503]|uniref:acetamidase/formamidase family protein n=1 Tax=Nocardia sp. NBC_01503 TaxID=2975997 RepID=UPI002E7BF785|nr:acetamidase/formamidase family protein [Nocardia sp. NBC_01503]WTL30297.1 acetamidase/formamidase family protein [Nocardia sp. NBC_01503]